MPSFTPNLNLYKPGGGSTGLITPDEVVDIDRINANMDLIDAYAGTTNTSVNDLKTERGLVHIRPGSISGPNTSLTANGTVLIGATGNNNRINIDNVFDPSKYRRYRVLYSVKKSSTSTNMAMVFRSTSSADLSSADYHLTQITSVSGGNPFSSKVISSTNMSTFMDAIGRYVFGEFDLTFSETLDAVSLIGQVSGRVGDVEIKTVSISYEGSLASTVRGIGISPGQETESARWSFYGYVD